MNSQCGYVVIYDSGGAQSFFWNENDMNSHKDTRIPKSKHKIDKECVFVDPYSKKKTIHFLYQSDVNGFKILAVSSSYFKLKKFAKTHGYTYENKCFFGDLEMN